jgi:HEAT repeat protein
MGRRRSVRFGWLLLLAAFPAIGADPPQTRPKLDVTPKRVDESPATLSKRLDEALAAGNFENSLYAYRSLVYATGAEDPARLGQVARLALVADMRTGKNWIRLGAAEALARRGDTEALALLRHDAGDTKVPPAFRLRAIQVLGEVGDKGAIATLGPLPFDTARPATERLAATDALLALGEVESAQYLVGVLSGPRGPDRLRAAEILADRKVAVADALRRASKIEGDGDLHIACLRGLALQKDNDALATLRREFGEDSNLVIPTVELGVPPTVPGGESPTPTEAPEPTKRMDFREVMLRLKLAGALLDAGDPLPVQYVANVIRDGNTPGDHGKLAARVAKFDPALGLDLLRRALSGGDPDSQASAAAELVRLGHPEGVVEALSIGYRTTLSEDESASGPRQRPIEALARMRLPSAAPILREALGDPETLIRITAASGLASLGEADGVAELRRVLDAGQPVDALRAAEMLLDNTSTAAAPKPAAR